MLFIAYTQKALTNTHDKVSSNACGVNFDLCIHPHPFFAYASSEGSDQAVHKRRLTSLMLDNTISSKSSRIGLIPINSRVTPIFFSFSLHFLHL